MRRSLLSLVLALGFGAVAHAQDADIEATIDAQLEAFKADDMTGAFTHASRSIQDIFRTPENFGAMVRNGYPMVWRPGAVQFLELREISGALWQKVMITDAAGAIHVLDYQMIETENGWKINGVQMLESSAASV